MQKTLLTIIAVLATAPVALASDELPGKPQDHAVAVVGADVYPADREPIVGGTVVFDHGKIVGVGKDASIPSGAEVIDGHGKRVYPGLFDAMTDLGLVEIDAVRATLDESEAGTINPNARAEVAVNPDSELIPVARSNGVLLALTAPSGGMLAGTSAVIQLDGWTTEDMTLRAPVAMHLTWPAMSQQRTWRNVARPETDQNKQRDEALRKLKETFDDARAYWTAAKATSKAHGSAVGTSDEKAAPTTQPDFDARWEAMVPLFEQKIPLIVVANEQQQIEAAVAFAARQNVKLIIAGGADAGIPRVAEMLKRQQVPVIVNGVQRLPQRRGDAYDAAFTLPKRLHDAGVTFCISADRGPSTVRNLPYHAATAAAFGLSPEDALRSITLWPAQILGVEDRVGSLTDGKDATLIVCDGDILEEPTHVERAYIQGRQVDLNDKQKRLYEKYKTKYARQKDVAKDKPQNAANTGERSTGG